MAQMLSPGVYVEEIDNSAIVPNEAANIAFLAGNFNRGPQDLPYVVTTKQEYEDIFGTPSDSNYNEWFQGFKFFDYGNQLVITRGVNTPLDELHSMDATSPVEKIYQYIGNPVLGDPIYDKKLYDTYLDHLTDEGAVGSDPYVVGMYRSVPIDATLENGDKVYLGITQAAGKVIEATDTLPAGAPAGAQSYYEVALEEDVVANVITELNGDIYKDEEVQGVTTLKIVIKQFDYKYILKVGDYFHLENVQEVFKVHSFIANTVALSTGGSEVRITIQATHQGVNTIPPGTVWAENGYLYQIAASHQNGSTQAYRRYGSDGLEVNTRLNQFNIDIKEGPNGDEINDTRLNYDYSLIKNDPDFDFKKESNELNSFMEDFKLKFFSKTSNNDYIEIAIANVQDFEEDQQTHQNLAVAFEDGQNKTMLTSLYDYYPVDEDVAVMIKYGDEIESFIVSMDDESIDGNGKSNYIETVINDQSKFVYVVDNKGIQENPATYLVTDRTGGLPMQGVTPKYTSVLKIYGGRNPKLDLGAIKSAYKSVLDKDKYEIDVVIGNEEYPNVGIELSETRKDCITYCGARMESCVGKKAIDATNKIVEDIKTGYPSNIPGVLTSKITRTMFAAFFGNYFRIYDKYNKKYRWINVAGDMAGIRCDVTSNTAPWWVSAGMKRGIIRNINKIAFTPSEDQRDLLYKNGINPIVSFPGTGNLVWGNKTLHPIASSFDRINVRTLFNTLERAMAKAARSQVFEFNDPYTRNSILSMFNPYLATIKAGRGITDYMVICDETNNTPDVISRNEMRVDIYIKPNYAAEMILLTFTNVGTRSFADVIGG